MEWGENRVKVRILASICLEEDEKLAKETEKGKRDPGLSSVIGAQAGENSKQGMVNEKAK